MAEGGLSGLSGLSGISYCGGTPATPVLEFPVVTSSRLWLSRDRNLHSASDGTGPVPSFGGTIGSWQAVGEGWGTDILSQPTAGLRPLLQTDGIQSDGTDDELVLPARITLGANFTFYFVSDRAISDDIVIPLGGNHAGPDFGDMLALWTSGIFYVISAMDGPNVPDTFTDNRIRRVRRSGTTVWLKTSGAEQVVTVSLPGVIRFDKILSRTGSGTGFQSSSARLTQIVLVEKTITPGDADDLAIIAKLQELETGVVGP